MPSIPGNPLETPGILMWPLEENTENAPETPGNLDICHAGHPAFQNW